MSLFEKIVWLNVEGKHVREKKCTENGSCFYGVIASWPPACQMYRKRIMFLWRYLKVVSSLSNVSTRAECFGLSQQTRAVTETGSDGQCAQITPSSKRVSS
ncbi:hypothetical protein BaRGS_00012158 [Batillaria attramentaria]|uniref:Uncharacterized protein n=1 Tax=Batillaria attramentaria TaxID=370345 RepID=A0ABD0LB43_9CAEN